MAYLLTPQRVNDFFLADLTTGASLCNGRTVIACVVERGITGTPLESLTAGQNVVTACGFTHTAAL